MSQGTIEIIAAGAFTTVQDAGRSGAGDMGILQCGSMDPVSMRAANLLLGNPADEAVLECTLTGPEIRFTVPCAFSVSGADMQPELDGQRIPMNAAVTAKAGSVLKLKSAVCGLRSYIAVKGGLDLPMVFGSRSTDVKCGIGGYCGRKLASGDAIGLRAPETALTDRYKRYLTKKEEARFLPHLSETDGEVLLRVMWGPQADRFPEEAKRVFTTNRYILSAESDRMGSRFAGPVIPADGGTDIVSDGIVSGAVQVTSAGMPIVMTADHQTTGGYAKIAAVITADLPLLAQLRPGTAVRFVPVGLKAAKKAARAVGKRMKQLKRAVN